MSRDKFIEVVTKHDQDHARDMSLDDYVDVCQELIDYFSMNRDAAIDDLERDR